MEKEEPLSEIKIIDSLSISNVLIFVLESTPKRYISVYDTTYDVTPNLSKWKNIASIFPNMYSHIPTTTNSMATMISGMYPLISYKSIIKDNLSQSLPSIGAVLKAQNWENSLLVSSDLAFGSMDVYAQHAGFNLIKDNKSIHCDYPSFHITQTQLDGLDDRCLAHEYLNWIDSLHDKKKFSILWTNQTHYPYFINSENEKKFTDDKELNRYLNGLKSSDEAFGILMEGLQKRNLLNQSLIIVVGDHGESFGTHDQKGHGNTVYEEEVNVPCLIYNPVLGSGTVHDVIGGMVDIAPTISHLLRIPLPVVCEGKSLFSVRKNARTFFLCPYSNFVLGTRTQKWKFIYNATSNTNELYDIQNDPMELNDLSKKFPDVVKFEYQMLGGWVQFHNNRLQEISKGANTNVQ
jgi:phosphoglycerol transferase MdoB-like AlkP superfamily enzyme